MKYSNLLMILVSVSLTATAQIALKYGMSDRRIAQLIAAKSYFQLPIQVATSPAILSGLVLFAVSVAIWLAVLASVPLSIAYPFVSLGICLTTLAGTLLFHEAFTLYKAFGVALIVCGILCISAGRFD